MTLIVSIINKRRAIQVSVRRITSNYGSAVVLHSDDQNKSLYVRCQDGHFALSYTGLARIQHQGTDQYLAKTLAMANIPYRSVKDALNLLEGPVRAAFQDELQRLPRIVPTLFVIGGIAFGGKRRAKGMVHGHVALTHGKYSQIVDDSKEKVHAFGSISAIPVASEKRLKDLAQSGFFRTADRASAVEELVKFIRASSSTTADGRYVGRACVSTVIEAESDGSCDMQYHWPTSLSVLTPTVTAPVPNVVNFTLRASKNGLLNYGADASTSLHSQWS